LESFRAGSVPPFDAGLARALDVPLVHRLLRNTIVRDLEFEALLTAARRTLLSAAYDTPDPAGTIPLKFATSLACQCFNPEYVYASESSEEQQVDSLAADLGRWLEGAENLVCDPRFAIAVCGMYRPLWSLDPKRRLLQLATESWAAALAPLISS